MHEDNPCVVIPTGGGKTPILAELCRAAVKDWSGRVTVLAHVRELLEQSYDHLTAADPTLAVGLYSAGLKAKDAGYPVTVAGIQSAVNNPEAFGHQDLVIVDEAHRIPPEGEGQYRTFIAALRARNPALRIIGLTATPYRMSTGSICHKDNLLNKICFEVGIRELIVKGYLSPVSAAGQRDEQDFSSVAVRGGEFVKDELEAFMNDDTKVILAIGELLERAKDRHAILVFASGVDHGKKITTMLKEAGESVRQVYGETKPDDRDDAIREFREGRARILVNVDVLTLGFDAPNVDCVALLRATKSPGLYYQMVGRGFRIHESKKDCLVLDFGGNVLRHGLVDEIDPGEGRTKREGEAPVKKCPACLHYCASSCRTCPVCGQEFPVESRGLSHDTKSYAGDVVSNDDDREPALLSVYDVEYALHEKTKENGTVSRTLRVMYYYDGMEAWPVSEYICLEHGGYAGEKARDWWRRRDTKTQIPPLKIEDALDRRQDLLKPTTIQVARDGKYLRVVGYNF